MTEISLSAVNALEAAIDRKIANAAPKRTRTGGTVNRVDVDGTVYVIVDGSSTETPASSVSASVRPGDSVNVTVQDGRLTIDGNYTDPSAGSVRVSNVEATANDAVASAYKAGVAATAAESDAARAQEAADAAQSSADDAATAASSAWDRAGDALAAAGQASDAASAAQSSADNAQASANSALASAANASEYASRALGNLSTVQSVSETLTWITQHGTMTLTTDTALDPTHVYFVQDAEGDYVVGNTHYSIVAEPVASQLSSYYVLTIDESLNNYVGTHLALTNEGLWLLPASTNTYKVLIATGAGTTYTTAGTYIVDNSGGTVAKFTASEITIGEVLSGNYALIDSDGMDIVHATTSGGTTTTTEVAHFGYGQCSYGNVTYTAPYFSFGNRASGSNVGGWSFAEGRNTAAIGHSSHSEGDGTWSGNNASHSEGVVTSARGYGSHSEGVSNHSTISSGIRICGIDASGDGSHAEGYASNSSSISITASGTGSHAEGYVDNSSGDTIAAGNGSHAQNYGTRALSNYQTALGKCNVADSNNTYAVIVGNGTADNARSNALTIDWNGNVECGNVECGNVNGTATQSTGTLASSDNQTALGKYNVSDANSTYAIIVGNGTDDSARSNALTLDWNGVLYVASGYMLPNGSQIWDNTNRIIHMQTPDAGTAQAEFTFEPDGKIYNRKRTRSSAGASWGSWSSWTAIAG